MLETPSVHRRNLRGVDFNQEEIMDGNIFNTKGRRVGSVRGAAIFDLTGKKLYELKGINIYRPSGELVGHLSRGQGSEHRLDRATEKLFQ
jgi:hypothetical protein